MIIVGMVAVFVAGMFMGIALISVLAAGKTTMDPEKVDANIRTLWQSVNRIGDECDSMRGRIYSLEKKLEEKASYEYAGKKM